VANQNRPAGLSPLEYLDGSPYNGKARMYYIAPNNGSVFAIGDPVVMSGDGDANGVAGVALATAGTSAIILGAIVGMGSIVYGGAGVDPNLPNNVIVPAAKTRAYYVLVSDDPSIVYSVQEGGAGAALTAADCGRGFNLLSGTNTGFVSGWQFDNASGGVEVGRQLQLLGLVQTTQADNSFGTYAKWKVRINCHQYTTGQAGV
jgi:hypothetical protein